MDRTLNEDLLSAVLEIEIRKPTQRETSLIENFLMAKTPVDGQKYTVRGYSLLIAGNEIYMTSHRDGSRVVIPYLP